MSYGANYSTPGYVSTLAHALLTAASTALGATVPTTTYISAGKPAADGCDQLVVWADAFKMVRPRATSSRGGGGVFAEDRQSLNPQGGLPAVDFQVQILRCGAPAVKGEVTPVLPSAAELDTFATTHLTDGWQMYLGLLQAWKAGTLFGALEHVPAAVVIGQANPYGTEGGTAGWTVPVTIGLY